MERNENIIIADKNNRTRVFHQIIKTQK